jgi:hypothetical protein
MKHLYAVPRFSVCYQLKSNHIFFSVLRTQSAQDTSEVLRMFTVLIVAPMKVVRPTAWDDWDAYVQGRLLLRKVDTCLSERGWSAWGRYGDMQ